MAPMIRAARLIRRAHSPPRGTMPVLLAAVLGMLLPMLAPSAAQAQEARTTVSIPAPRGWIGILYEGDEQGRPVLRGVGGRGGLLVREVVPGSPARAAGLRSGDILLAIDGRGVTAVGADPLQVRAGQPLILQLLRDGRVLESRLVAALRPVDLPDIGDPRRRARVDSLRDRIIQEMDSLLLQEQRLGQSQSVVGLFGSSGEEEPTMSVVRTRDLPSPPGAEGASRRGIPGGREEGAARDWTTLSPVEPREGVPFGIFALRGNPGNELALELQRIRGAMESLRMADRTQPGEALREPEQLMAEARRLLQRGARGDGRPAVAPPRPLSPHLLGQRVVAGAEVTPLNPDLAGYFGGEEGLLVLQVLPGSPAAAAGFVAGDVIIRMGDRRVREVEQARAALERSPRGPIPVTLVRRGRSVLVDLPR